MSAIGDLTRPPRSEANPLGVLLAWEAAARRQASAPELTYFLANELRRIVTCDQAFVLRRPLVGPKRGGGWRIEAASSLATVERNAPLVRAIEAALTEADEPAAIDAPAEPALDDYPFRHWLWQPLADREGVAFAGLLVARADPFGAGEASRLARVGETASHAWLALSGGRPPRRLPRLTRRQRRLLAAAAVGAVLFPVHLSALAPVEVVAAHPRIVTAPFAGVIAAVDVAPGASVARGQTLLRFDDVKLRNDAALAAQRLQVARAKVDSVSAATFGDATQGRGISIAQAEYQLAAAEDQAARDLLARATVTAPVAGTAILTDRREWEGRAVEVGQPIMEVADPADMRYRIDLPAREQMRLEPGSSVSIWLDSQPLWAEGARLVGASYQARPTADGTLAFALDARPDDGATPRIGSRGTARVRGSWAPLGYALLKRPIASLRQTLGF